ncbi:MAG: tetratricopeptide repeat protein [Terriglobales bacterium]|jgi:tetratricopeptide (TPR) repeat protein
MKQYFAVIALLMLVAGLCASPAFAQDTGSVKGVCKDVDGKPIVGATVEWVNLDNGRKYDIKTNSKGEYFSLGIGLGHYKVTLLGADGKEIFHYNGFAASTDESTLDFDMKKEAANAAKGSGLTPEQVKQQQEQAANVAKENMTIKSLNEKLAAAKTASDAGDFDTAIAQMTDATKMDPNRDLLWAKLGDYEATSAAKQTDSAEKAKRYDASVTDYQKAVELKQKAADAAPQKTPDATKVLAQYYNNLGKAQAQLGKTDDAVKAYNQAAQLDPAGAGMYYFNLGAILTNANTTSNADMRKAAAQAFDKAIAADPTRADAYYWKGTNLIGAATLQGDKMIAPDGTAEAFQKYLELAPTGPHAEEAKAMLQGLGATVETSYGKKKTTTTKKQQ